MSPEKKKIKLNVETSAQGYRLCPTVYPYLYLNSLPVGNLFLKRQVKKKGEQSESKNGILYSRQAEVSLPRSRF